MDARLNQYLTQAYRRDVMGESVVVEMPEPDPKMLAEIEAEIRRIDAIGLGAHLASRDFASYQHRRALLRLREQLRAQQRQEPKRIGPPKESEHERDTT